MYLCSNSYNYDNLNSIKDKYIYVAELAESHYSENVNNIMSLHEKVTKLKPSKCKFNPISKTTNKVYCVWICNCCPLAPASEDHKPHNQLWKSLCCLYSMRNIRQSLLPYNRTTSIQVMYKIYVRILSFIFQIHFTTPHRTSIRPLLKSRLHELGGE